MPATPRVCRDDSDESFVVSGERPHCVDGHEMRLAQFSRRMNELVWNSGPGTEIKIGPETEGIDSTSTFTFLNINHMN